MLRRCLLTGSRQLQGGHQEDQSLIRSFGRAWPEKEEGQSLCLTRWPWIWSIKPALWNPTKYSGCCEIFRNFLAGEHIDVHWFHTERARNHVLLPNLPVYSSYNCLERYSTFLSSVSHSSKLFNLSGMAGTPEFVASWLEGWWMAWESHLRLGSEATAELWGLQHVEYDMEPNAKFGSPWSIEKPQLGVQWNTSGMTVWKLKPESFQSVL